MRAFDEFLENEAGNFFAVPDEQQRDEAHAFQSASVASVARSEETDQAHHGT